MIKATLAIFCLLAAVLSASMVLAQTNTTMATTTTTMAPNTTTMAPNTTMTTTTTMVANTTMATTTTAVATTTTTAAPAETVSLQWGNNPIYQGNNYSVWVTLSKGVPANQVLTIKFHNMDPNLHIADITMTSGTSAYGMYWATGAPATGGNFFFDISLQGNASWMYSISGNAYASIGYMTKGDVTISAIPVDLTVGQQVNFSITLSRPLSSNSGYIQFFPNYDSTYLTVNSASSGMIQGNTTTMVWYTLIALKATSVNGTMLTFSVSGMEMDHYNAPTGGSQSTALHIFPATTSTTTAAQGPTTAAPTTTQQPGQTTTTSAMSSTGHVSISWASPIYPNHTYSAVVMLSMAVPAGQQLVIGFWNQDSNLHIPQNLTIDGSNPSSSNTWTVNYWATNAPQGMNSFQFDMSLTGSAANSFSWTPGTQAAAMIQYWPLDKVTATMIPVDAWVGTTYTFNVSISRALMSGGSLWIMPAYDRQYISFTPVSVEIKDNMTTTVTFSFTPLAANQNGTTIDFTLAGNDAYKFESKVAGGNKLVHIFPAQTTTQAGQTTTPTPPPMTTSSMMAPTTTSMAPETTTAAPQQTTAAPTTTAAPQQTTTSAAPQPTATKFVPPGWIVIKRKNKTPLTSVEKEKIRNDLAIFLNLPSSLITVGDVDATTGDVTVDLALDTAAGVDQAKIDAAITTANSFNSTQLNALGAASVSAGTPAPSTMAPEDEKDNLPLIIGCAVGGAVLLFIILAIIKAKSSAGTGVAAANGAGGDRPLSQMENEMNQHRGGRTIDNEL